MRGLTANAPAVLIDPKSFAPGALLGRLSFARMGNVIP